MELELPGIFVGNNTGLECGLFGHYTAATSQIVLVSNQVDGTLGLGIEFVEVLPSTRLRWLGNMTVAAGTNASGITPENIIRLGVNKRCTLRLLCHCCWYWPDPRYGFPGTNRNSTPSIFFAYRIIQIATKLGGAQVLDSMTVSENLRTVTVDPSQTRIFPNSASVMAAV